MTYENPLCQRYASKQMQEIFSKENKFRTFRKLWTLLAESQMELGLDIISQDMVNQMRANIENIDFDKAEEYEVKFKHDVMAHVHEFCDHLDEKTASVVHLGVTSAFVGDNTDLICIKQALILLKGKLLNLMNILSDFSLKYKAVPSLAYTHFQPAQLTTVGKRATLWLKDIAYDFDEVCNLIDSLEFRGVKGTTGTQASFKNLFNSYDKVKKLDDLVTKKAGFLKKQEVSGQTYSRKQDTKVLQVLANIASSAHKFSTDFRLLQHLKELEEPFAKNQIGSSAMAYKRNPMRSERISSLSKFVMSLEINGHLVHGTQWFERTLDDSANKRLSYPQAFLSVDAILDIWINIAQGIVVYEKVIEKNVLRELPFMITEDIMMLCVKKGQNRQEVHEIIRQHSMEQAYEIKMNGKENLLIERLLEDSRLNIDKSDLNDILDPKKYVGFSEQQTEDYISLIKEKIGEYKDEIDNEVKDFKY